MTESEEYQYEYDTVDESKVEDLGGVRLVGARSASMENEAPFIVAINSYG